MTEYREETGERLMALQTPQTSAEGHTWRQVKGLLEGIIIKNTL